MKVGLIATTIIVMLLGARDNYRPKISVDLAKVLVSAGVDNTPKPIPEPEGPHPDVDKCICKGTGIIVQGDGHESKCPYHGKNEETGCTKDTCTGDCGDNCRCRSGEACTAPPTKVDGKIKLISNEVEKKEEPEYNLYYFGATWCGPCKRMKRDVWNEKIHKDVYQLLKERKIKLTMLDWNTKEHSGLFKQYKVTTLPQTILVKRNSTKKLLHYKGSVGKISLLKKIRERTND